MFKEAIKTEQRRIQRLIDLSAISDERRGNLCLQKRGQKTYAYERWQPQDQPERKVYLGPLDSAPVQELYSVKYQGRGILFRYDCVIEVVDRQGNPKILCPDFMIQCFDGTVIIIEHLGRMGDLRYALDFGERCYWYFQEGFILGSTFFVTSDDPDHGTDSQMIARVVDRVEEMFFGF